MKRMTIKEKIAVLKKRKRRLRRAVATNQKILDRLANKSRHVRARNMAGPRKGFFRDLELEVGYAIDFLEGNCSEKDYLNLQVNESF